MKELCWSRISTGVFEVRRREELKAGEASSQSCIIEFSPLSLFSLKNDFIRDTEPSLKCKEGEAKEGDAEKVHILHLGFPFLWERVGLDLDLVLDIRADPWYSGSTVWFWSSLLRKPLSSFFSVPTEKMLTIWWPSPYHSSTPWLYFAEYFYLIRCKTQIKTNKEHVEKKFTSIGNSTSLTFLPNPVLQHVNHGRSF